jgi:dihydroflavonol-4-reductase
MTGSRCLVTGAAGFLGTELCRHLAADGHEITVLVRSKDAMPAEAPACRIVVGDILNRESVAAAVQDQDVVFHLAAIISYSPKDREKMFRVNVMGSVIVAQECLRQSEFDEICNSLYESSPFSDSML